nr:protein FAM240A isoform X2 [Manis javanica]
MPCVVPREELMDSRSCAGRRCSGQASQPAKRRAATRMRRPSLWEPRGSLRTRRISADRCGHGLCGAGCWGSRGGLAREHRPDSVPAVRGRWARPRAQGRMEAETGNKAEIAEQSRGD